MKSSPSTVGRIKELQRRVFAHYGTEVASRYLSLKDPPLKVHLFEAGEGKPVIMLQGQRFHDIKLLSLAKCVLVLLTRVYEFCKIYVQ